ncbi:GTP-binding protein, partial [Myxococcota bacterium]
FKQGGIYRQNQQVVEQAMDVGDQERERGITILAKTTSVNFGDLNLQIVDTPGHSDFGGEVERSLNMVDGVLLLVDAAEGPLPQTRFVLRKALGLALPTVVVINKIDRKDARPAAVLDKITDLFIDLGADDELLDFPVVYTVATDGVASLDSAVRGRDLQPLVSVIEKTIPPPEDHTDEPFCMQVNQVSYDDFVGRLVIGRIVAGRVTANQNVLVQSETGALSARISGVYAFRGLERMALDSARSGDIVALSGVETVAIGDTLCDPERPTRLPHIRVDDPTVAMVFRVNDGPFAGHCGKYVTSRQLGRRLAREAYANISIRVEPGHTPDQFRVLGRGELQLSVLIEAMRREGYELCVCNPEVVTRVGDAGKEEPTERLVIDAPAEYVGAVSELLGKRRSSLLDQRQEGSRVRLEYIIPTRGLFGLRGRLLTMTRGTAMAHNVFEGWAASSKPIESRANGALVCDREGTTTPYALFHLQPRGILFVGAGTRVYEGMIIGEHNRANDLNVNAAREKKLTNVRAAGKDDATVLSSCHEMTLERSLEWIRNDESIEITPLAIRLRKTVLPAGSRTPHPRDA